MSILLEKSVIVDLIYAIVLYVACQLFVRFCSRIRGLEQSWCTFFTMIERCMGRGRGLLDLAPFLHYYSVVACERDRRCRQRHSCL
jgi:hypothetical protein